MTTQEPPNSNQVDEARREPIADAILAPAHPPRAMENRVLIDLKAITLHKNRHEAMHAFETRQRVECGSTTDSQTTADVDISIPEHQPPDQVSHTRTDALDEWISTTGPDTDDDIELLGMSMAEQGQNVLWLVLAITVEGGDPGARCSPKAC